MLVIEFWVTKMLQDNHNTLHPHLAISHMENISNLLYSQKAKLITTNGIIETDCGLVKVK